MGAFFVRLRDELGGDPFPYLWVPEWHKTGHGLHLHFAVGRYIPRSLIDQAWGHGFVHIKQLSGASAGSGRWGRARRAASYLSKYVTKSFEDDDQAQRPKGLHRFDRAQSFTPRLVQITANSRADLITKGCEAMGGNFARSWFSDDSQGWQGAPALWLQWDGR